MQYTNAIGETNHHADAIADAWKTWVTEGELLWVTEAVAYSVPEDFLTDFTSIPAVFRWLFRVNGAPYQVAAVLHDYLYSSTTVSRKEADLAFYWLSRAVGTPEVKAAIMYVALRLGGWMAYRSNQKKLKEQGVGWRFLTA